MAQRGGTKVGNSLLSASCAAVLAVYAAGYTRTKSAADRLASQVAERRAAVPAEARTYLPKGTMSQQGVMDDMPAPLPLPPPPPTKTERNSPFPQRDIFPENAYPVTAPATPDAPFVSLPDGQSPLAASGEPPKEAPVPAPAPEPAAPSADHPADAAAAAPPDAMWKDGTYTGWGYSRHGNIEASVVIEGGRIASAVISQCRTRYSCSVIDRLPPQVAARQSPNVDYVSGATQSADAFYGAVVEALSKAK